MSYLLPAGETTLDGACAFGDGLCAWSGRAAYRWDANAGWTSLSDAPAAIESGFELRSGVLAGGGSQVGFLPADASDWAGWVDLGSTFSDAHPMYGDLLFCTDQQEETYVLFEVSASGLEPLSQFDVEELTTPVAGWSPPGTPERLLLLGEDGLWALDPPYSTAELQHLVSFDGVDMPPLEEIPAPFQPGAATVVVPRRGRAALRLDLSDGSGTATGLKHVPGGAALWSAYLRGNRAAANRLLGALAALPGPPAGTGPQLHAALRAEGDADAVQAVATSAGLWRPRAEDAPARATTTLRDTPFDPSALATWALWLDWDGALDDACRLLCNAEAPDYALAESLRTFAGLDAVRALFDLLGSADPPAGPDGMHRYPAAALRALVAPFGAEAAPLVASALTAPSVPLRVAACAAAGAGAPGDDGEASDGDTTPPPALWTDAHPLPEEALRTNLHHDHAAVRAAARDTCTRLSVETRPPAQTP